MGPLCLELPQSREAVNDVDFVVQHRRGEARVGTKENRGVHDFVRTSEGSGDAEGGGPVSFQLNENRLSEQVAAEEHPVADLLLIKMTPKFDVRESRGRLYPNHKTEPGTVRSATGRVPAEP